MIWTLSFINWKELQILTKQCEDTFPNIVVLSILKVRYVNENGIEQDNCTPYVRRQSGIRIIRRLYLAGAERSTADVNYLTIALPH